VAAGLSERRWYQRLSQSSGIDRRQYFPEFIRRLPTTLHTYGQRHDFIQSRGTKRYMVLEWWWRHTQNCGTRRHHSNKWHHHGIHHSAYLLAVLGSETAVLWHLTRPVSDWPRSWSWSYTFGLGLGLGLAALVSVLVLVLYFWSCFQHGCAREDAVWVTL